MKNNQSTTGAILIKILLSIVFLLSMFGKWSSLASTAPAMAELFYLSPNLATTFVFVLIAVELIVIVLLWLKPVRILLLVPIAFLVITAYSQYRSLDCSCFGNLAIISQLPLWGHLILLFALLAGFLFIVPGTGEKKWLAQLAIGLFCLAGLSLLFPSSEPAAQMPVAIPSIDFPAVNQAIIDETALLIDARSEMQFLYGTIGDAISIPHDTANLDSLIQLWDLVEQNLIVFCSSAHCEKADILATRLQQAGCDSIKIYHGGWDDWVEKEVLLED